MAWHELPLMFFTVLAQISVGAFIVMGFVLLQSAVSDSDKAQITKSMFALWVLLGLGFALSTGHLGSPFRALNSLNMVGSSCLSNEIFFGALFFASGGLFWLLEMLGKSTPAVRKGLMIAAMVLGIIFMRAMIHVYQIETVPTWDTPVTPVSFAVTVVLAGIILGQLLLAYSGYENARFSRVLAVIASIALVMGIAASVYQVDQLNGVNTAIASARDLVPNIASLKANYIVLLALVALICLFPQLSMKKVALPALAGGFVLVFAAEFLNRAIFYSLHMSAGL